MIRPLTIATVLMACGSGLYLYQSKHEVQVLDKTIEQAVHETGALREQSRLLAAEWTMLNDPDRLQQFSNTYLALKTINPAQFTSLADLDSRLPPPEAEAPPRADEGVPVAMETAPQLLAGTSSDPASDPAVATVAGDVLPVPPVPAVRQAPSDAPVVAAAHAKAPLPHAVGGPVGGDAQTRPVVVADTRPANPRPMEQRAARRIADAHVEVRAPSALPRRPVVIAPPRPRIASVSVNAPSYARPAAPLFRPVMAAAPVPYGGSLLGMARGTMPSAPRPTPVNAAYNAN